MTALLIAFTALSAWAVIATIEIVGRDGYGRIPTREYSGRPW